MEEIELEEQKYVTLPNPMKRVLFFNKDVDQDSIGALSEKLITIQNHDDYLKRLYAVHNLIYNPFPIKIYIDSYGGDVYTCFGLLSIMEASETPIHTIVTGTAMSCGFMIALHGHRRFAYPHATLMYHNVSTISGGTPADIQEQLEETLRLQGSIEGMILRRTKISKTKLGEIFMTRGDWYMNTEQALAVGCIDEVIGVKQQPSTIAASKKKTATDT